MNSINPKVVGFLLAVQAFLVALGGFMAKYGLGSTGLQGDVMMAAAAVMVLGAPAYMIYYAYTAMKTSSAVSVQAGINLATSGQAVDKEGDPIDRFAHDATPPKQVTQETATQIVAKYGPAASEIKKT